MWAAGALAEIGLPASGIAMPLLLFNLGVELGQVLVVFGAGISIAVVSSSRSRTITASSRGSFLDRALVYGVGILTAYWCFERSLGWLL